METDTLKAGDIVVLNSGSVNMTIERITLFGKRAWVTFTHTSKSTYSYDKGISIHENEDWYYERKRFAVAALKKAS